MSFRTCKRSCKVQSCVSTGSLGSTLSKLLLFLFDDLNKLAGIQTLSLKLFNIPAAAFAGLKALSRIYINENV